MKQRIDIRKFRVLDVGFNKGVYKWYFSDVLGCSDYSGVEIDGNFLNKYPNTFYHDFEKNKLNKYYDLIFCSHVLEHINDDCSFINNMAHSLKNDNSILILRIPMPTNDTVYFRKFNKKSHSHTEHVRDGYTLKEVKIILNKINLKVDLSYLSIGSLGLFIHTFFEILRDYQIRFHRVLQFPYIIISLVEIYLIKSKKTSDLLVVASKI